MARKKKEKEKELCSIDEEMLMWTSYRYCIGRHTYVSSLADYIAKKYYGILSDQRLEFTARDIMDCIGEHLRFGACELKYSGTVMREDRKPLWDLFEFWTKNNIDSEEKVLGIKEVEIYHESYRTGEEHKYHVTNAVPNVRNYVSSMDYVELIGWMNLACFFDKKNYKKLHVKFNGEEKDVIAFESWVEDLRPDEKQEDVYYSWPWHWKKVYISIDSFREKGNYAGYIIDEYIMSVEEYDGREYKED